MAEATVPVLDRGFLYGDSVYEVFRTEDGVPLFLDDHVVENIEGLQRVTHQATKSPPNPVLRRGKPWETFRVMLYGTVVYDEEDQLFKMWYAPIPKNSAVKEAVKVNGKNRGPWVTLVAYATSQDGVHWDTPNLGQVDFEGSRDNNLINIGQDNIEGISVLRNSHSSDPNKKWLAFFWEHHSYRSSEFGVPPYDDSAPGVWEHGMWAAYSADGIHWDVPRHWRTPVIPQGADTQLVSYWEPRLRRYVVYLRWPAQRAHHLHSRERGLRELDTPHRLPLRLPHPQRGLGRRQPDRGLAAGVDEPDGHPIDLLQRRPHLAPRR